MAEPIVTTETDPVANVLIVDIRKNAEAIGKGLSSLTDKGIEELKVNLNKEVKVINPGIAYHNFYDGGLLSKDGFDLIKENVPDDQVKSVTIRVPLYNEDKTQIIGGKDEIRYFCPNVVDMGKKSDAGLLDTDTSLTFRHADSSNRAELNDLQAKKGVFTVNKKALKAEVACREAARIKVEMEKRQLKTATLKEMVTKHYPSLVVPIPA